MNSVSDEPKPTLFSTVALVAANAVACLLVFFPRLEFAWVRGPGSLDVVMKLGSLQMLLTAWLAVQGVFFICERTRVVTPTPLWKRAVVYCLPAVIIGVLRTIHPTHAHPTPDQEDPAVAPSGKYVARIDIPDESWCFQIFDADQSQELFRADTGFSGYHGGYWAWDSHDRFWFRCGDDGRISYWTLEGPAWLRHEWRWEPDVEPPQIVLHEDQWWKFEQTYRK